MFISFNSHKKSKTSYKTCFGICISEGKCHFSQMVSCYSSLYVNTYYWFIPCTEMYVLRLKLQLWPTPFMVGLKNVNTQIRFQSARPMKSEVCMSFESWLFQWNKDLFNLCYSSSVFYWTSFQHQKSPMQNKTHWPRCARHFSHGAVWCCRIIFVWDLHNSCI